MARCSHCGKTGLFLKLQNGLCKNCVVENHTRFTGTENEQQVDACSYETTAEAEGKRKHDLYMAAWMDMDFRNLQTQYYKLIEEIEADYSVFINGLGGDNAGELLEKKCLRGTILFHQMYPFYKKYEQTLPNSIPPFKRLSMLREKRGDFEGAALACVQQMRYGVFGDSSKSGMRGRLARIIKKGKFQDNEEIMREARKYLEI